MKGILRELPFIDDARIIIVPVSEMKLILLFLQRMSIRLVQKSISGFDKGSVSVFEKNIFGMGQNSE